ncbi:MAG TPA: hypothetical protein VMR00_16445 [Streptosporangiaceae bacterium]|nr:hypothetical protein [Streptosporangiaceae bacterium]
MTDSTANGECCRHAAELREEITSAIGLAEQLVSLLLTEARQAQGRPALHVVGRPPAPEKAERLAEVIDFAARRVSGS